MAFGVEADVAHSVMQVGTNSEGDVWSSYIDKSACATLFTVIGQNCIRRCQAVHTSVVCCEDSI